MVKQKWKNSDALCVFQSLTSCLNHLIGFDHCGCQVSSLINRTPVYFYKAAPLHTSEMGCRCSRWAGALREKDRLLDNNANDFILFFSSVPPPSSFLILLETFFHYAIPDIINKFVSAGTARLPPSANDLYLIRLDFFFLQNWLIKLMVLPLRFSACLMCSDNSLTGLLLHLPAGQRLPQLRASGHEDALLSLLLGPGGPQALPELLSQRDARLSGQPGRPGRRVEQLSG